jgi:DNA-binding GntR family transcriptional regulator
MRADRIAVRPAKRLSSTVYEELKELMIDGRFEPDTRLSVDDLAAQFEVSRQPVMDALRMLSTEGFVTIIPQVGCRIMSYELSAIREYFEAVAVMEGANAALAAVRGSDSHLRELDRIVKELRKAGDATGVQTRLLNRHFHRVILDMADSAITRRISEQLWDFSDFLYYTACRPFITAKSTREFRQTQSSLVESLRHRDPELSKLQMELYLANVRSLIPVA